MDIALWRRRRGCGGAKMFGHRMSGRVSPPARDEEEQLISQRPPKLASNPPYARVALGCLACVCVLSTAGGAAALYALAPPLRTAKPKALPALLRKFALASERPAELGQLFPHWDAEDASETGKRAVQDLAAAVGWLAARAEPPA
jgi:hypothetical protein